VAERQGELVRFLLGGDEAAAFDLGDDALVQSGELAEVADAQPGPQPELAECRRGGASRFRPERL
jgi:hypothetical protein